MEKSEEYLYKGIWMTTGGWEAIENAYNEETRKELSRNIFFFPGIWSPQELESRREELQQTEVIFTTWGMFSLTEEEMKKISSLDQKKRYYKSDEHLLRSYVKMVPDVDGQK